MATAGAEPERPPTYHPRLEFAVTAEQDGVDGRVELLEDARITPGQRSALERWHHGAECDGTIVEVCRSVESYELMLSRFRLVDHNGSELGLRELEEPFAEVELVYLGPDRRPTYMVTVDMSIGAGAYNGPVTRFAEVSRGALHWLTAVDASGHVEEIAVMSSLRTAWHLTPRLDGRGQDILFMYAVAADSGRRVRCVFRRDLNADSGTT